MKNTNLSRLLLIGLLAATAITSTACAERSVTNMQTVVSSDCGKSWRLIQVGQAIPKQLMACDLRVSIPNYPMQGEAGFKVNFKGNVLVSASSSYEYTITDPMKFIANARYVGRQNSAADGSANGAGAYETAENLLIDRRLREVADSMTDNEDIVVFDSSAFEDRLLIAVNKELEERGVQLNSITFVPMPDPQTRMAIDVGAAVRVYDAVGLGELGRQILVARAGASNIVVNPAPKADPGDNN